MKNKKQNVREVNGMPGNTVMILEQKRPSYDPKSKTLRRKRSEILTISKIKILQGKIYHE